MALLAERGAVTVTQLARALDVPTTTAHRILGDCRASGFATQQRWGGPYTVGPTLRETARLLEAESRLNEATDAAMSWLASESGEMVALAVLEGRTVRFVESIPGTRETSIGPQNGRVLPAYATAAGKAMLSRRDSSDVRRYFPASGDEPEPLQGTTWQQFAAQLERVRQTGWAVTMGGFRAPIASVASPIVAGDGTCTSAVVVVAPRSRLDMRHELLETAKLVVKAADRIHRRARPIAVGRP
ncbi:IclR family transcriptional regulator [Pseudoclavibacter endophyticus]|uniref:IclR family transcriptional regulator n=1 Tax=Pseudoclavibacter endophyticus TaxID=1778590 RepID=UPI00166C209B|nr:IclR family transcriptional regulator [Pseudoclavibacter endophyticus]